MMRPRLHAFLGPLFLFLASLVALACAQASPEQKATVSVAKERAAGAPEASLPGLAAGLAGSATEEIEASTRFGVADSDGWGGENEATPEPQTPGARIAESTQNPSPGLLPNLLEVFAGSPAAPFTIASLESWRIAIPAIGVDAPITPVGLEPDGTMGAPEGPDVVGWYRYGPAPGQRGNVLLDGHIDWTNRQTGIPHGAVFWNLTKLAPGNQITLSDGARQFTYAVTEKRRFAWDDPAGASVLQPTTDARITLITCGGTFDRASRNYSLRDVVIAHLTG